MATGGQSGRGRMGAAAILGILLAVFACPVTATADGRNPGASEPTMVAIGPGLMSFQGDLRDGASKPLNGTYDMIFRFFDSAAGGTLLLTDSHSAPGGVTLTEGLYDTLLGGGALTPGSQPSLGAVFANIPSVWLEIQVGSETLAPRMQITSAAYAQNATTLDGKGPDAFAATTHGHAGSDITGPVAEATSAQEAGNADTLDGQHAEGFAAAAHAHDASALTTGILPAARGGTGLGSPGASGNLLTSNGSTWTSTAAPTAASAGAVVDAANATLTRSGAGTAGNPFKLALNLASANMWSGAQTFSTNTYFPGPGIWTSSGRVGIGTGAPDANSRLDVRSTSSYAFMGYGNTAGGYFTNTGNTSYAEVGTATYGINAFGTAAGGYFHDSTPADTGQAWVATGNNGITATGSSFGIEANGNTGGGHFKDSDGTGEGWVGYGDRGIMANGSNCGGIFLDSSSSAFGAAGFDTYKIFGTGSVSFVQNHPLRPDRVIVYACPEGDEVATYTRGTAMLVDGEARVVLGETFKWVTNPDLGLTAHVTPRTRDGVLYVESVSTSELVVKSVKGFAPDAVFDYLVYGLRVGFEESSVVQEKRRESYIPSFKDHRDRYAMYPELRGFSAFERFKTMESAVRGVGPEALNLSRAEALKATIHEYDPATDPPVNELFGHGPGPLPSPAQAGQIAEKQAPAPVRLEHPPSEPGSDILGRKVPDEATQAPPAGLAPSLAPERFHVCEPVEAGDVLVSDTEREGAFCLGRQAFDAGVIGIATSEASPASNTGGPESAIFLVTVATSGIVDCKVDATYGPVAAKDLLVVSPTPGHAMKAVNPAPGTVLGKALEPLESGTGVIRVLVMLR